MVCCFYDNKVKTEQMKNKYPPLAQRNKTPFPALLLTPMHDAMSQSPRERVNVSHIGIDRSEEIHW